MFIDRGQSGSSTYLGVNLINCSYIGVNQEALHNTYLGGQSDKVFIDTYLGGQSDKVFIDRSQSGRKFISKGSIS